MRSGRENRALRLLIAFAVASTVPALVLGLWLPLSGEQKLIDMALTVIVLLPYSSTAVIAIGGALYALCAKFALLRWWSAMAAGALGGALVTYLIASPNSPSQDTLAAYSVAGIATSFVFWVLHPRGVAQSAT